jgi:signal transduction histidine kinase
LLKKAATAHYNTVITIVLAGYRFAALIILFIIIEITSAGAGAGLSDAQWLFFGLCGLTVWHYFLVIKQDTLRRWLAAELAVDYFYAILFGYFAPHLLFAEFIWIPYVAITAAVKLRKSGYIVLPLLFVGAVFLSYGFTRQSVFAFNRWAFPFYAVAPIYYLPMLLFALLAHRAWNAALDSRKKLAALEDTNAHLNKMNRTVSHKLFILQRDTRERERNRLSREIHDIAGYVFINLIMMLQAAHAVFDKNPFKSKTLISDARDYAERGINEIRWTLRNIRATVEQRLSLQNELFNIADVFEKATSVNVIIHYGAWHAHFTPELDFFWTVFLQEALTNAVKHGQATEIAVECGMEGPLIVMSVRDNGLGAKLPLVKGIGLSSLDSALEEYDGSVDIKTEVNGAGTGGFKITVSVPRSSV